MREERVEAGKGGGKIKSDIIWCYFVGVIGGKGKSKKIKIKEK